MSIERITAGNLRRTQAFDTELRSAANIDKIADAMADAILFEQNPAKRRGKVSTLVDRLVKETEKTVFPQAEKIGRQNAVDILSVTPDPIDLNNPTERAKALFQGRQRYTTRLTMVQESLDANATDLNSSLARYWLEPSEGSAQDKVQRLRKIHNELETKRKAWEADMRRYTEGAIKTRPTEPRLDFLSAMVSESKKDIRTQARRAGTDAEIAMFSAKGYAKFIWITPNGAAACPDCRNRQSVILTVPEWERMGRPGSGKTVCGSHCFCMLVPAEAVSKSSALLTGKHTREPGPLTSPDQLAVLNANRAVSVAGAERKIEQKTALAGKIAAPAPEPKPTRAATPEEWAKNLTKDEKEGIERFTGGNFRRMRAIQNGTLTEKDRPYAYREAKPWVDGMDEAVAKSPLWKGEAFRGIAGLTPEQAKSFKVGNAITLDAHSSFSVRQNVAEDFVRINAEPDKVNILFQAKMKSGVDVRPIRADEGEIIGVRGQRYIVTGTKDIEIVRHNDYTKQDVKTKAVLVEMEESPSKATLAQVKKRRAVPEAPEGALTPVSGAKPESLAPGVKIENRGKYTLVGTAEPAFGEFVGQDLTAIPNHITERMQSRGVNIVVAGRTTEALPPAVSARPPSGYSAGKGWDYAGGVYEPQSKNVVVSQTKLVKEIGDRGVTETFKPNARARATATHEFGHAVDYEFDTSGIKLSNKTDFKKAYNADKKSHSVEQQEQHAYYLQKGERGREEAFAEAFGVYTRKQAGTDFYEDRRYAEAFPNVLNQIGELFKGRI